MNGVRLPAHPLVAQRATVPTTTTEEATMADPRIDPRVVGPRKVGGRYFSGYWRTEYTVTAIEYRSDHIIGTTITCLWADGSGSSSHATAWCEREDRVLA